MNTFIWQQTLGVIISGQSEECPKIAHRNHKWLVISFFVFIWFSLTKCHLYQDYGSILFMTFCQLNTCHLKKIPSFSILISSKIANVDIPETPCPLTLHILTFRLFFGWWENLMFCRWDLLTFSVHTYQQSLVLGHTYDNFN